MDYQPPDYQPPKPDLDYLFRATVRVAAPKSLGRTSAGERRIVDIVGGTVAGPKLSGEVLPGGADWQIIRPDGSAVLDARYTIRAADGALIYVRNYGIRHGPPEILARIFSGEQVDPAHYYFRSSPVLETGAPQYAWLNNVIGVGSATRTRDGVVVDFYQVL